MNDTYSGAVVRFLSRPPCRHGEAPYLVVRGFGQGRSITASGTTAGTIDATPDGRPAAAKVSKGRNRISARGPQESQELTGAQDR